ncbi:segregation and condensation protein A [Lichenicoccus sp.]|uniref:segregation and condensation protein A n=1 Tax=Lichenicoccus sp. TaxID=2781899 RepID=UPI003D100EE4
MLTGGAPDCGAPLLRLDGFEGPLDLLLELARAQKVDLARISILQLVEQYLAVVGQARLELAADWLVMAAWLAWLKSRLLLPQEPGHAESEVEAEIVAGLLAARLAELAHVRRAASWLAHKDQLGHDVFARGVSEALTEVDRSGLELDVPRLLTAYLASMRRVARHRSYRPRPLGLWTMQEALSRLRRMLGDATVDQAGAGWCGFEAILAEWQPAGAAASIVAQRAAVAAALLAGLELARSGEVELAQAHAFGAIRVRGKQPAMLREAAE